MIDQPVLPPIARMSLALRETSERLGRELARPTSTAPTWTDFEWRIARAVSAMHGVSPLLRSRLRWEGPKSWMMFLHEQEHQSQKRHLRITELLREIDERGRRDGIALVALKGAALHGLGLYAAGQRPMGDIDLLIHKEDEPSTARLLAACGYEVAYVSRRHTAFHPSRKTKMPTIMLGEHIDNAIKIEVHTKVAEQLPRVDLTQHLFPSRASAGVNGYPSQTALMLHLLLHAAGNMRARALRLLQLHDIALLAAGFGPGNWEELATTRHDGRTAWWALAPLLLTERYYPNTVPSTVLASVGADCPRLLATIARRQLLADVSWSNIRIEAFPGIEWSRTVTEALSLVRARIWPTSAALLELKAGAAQIPDESAIPWYGLSHRARILRWIFSRPPRVQTLLSVRAALTQDI